jgi:hypothetical protein
VQDKDIGWKVSHQACQQSVFGDTEHFCCVGWGAYNSANTCTCSSQGYSQALLHARASCCAASYTLVHAIGPCR